jgi:hypothetical protein
MKKELDQIVTFGPGVKAFRIVVDADDVAEEKAGSQSDIATGLVE